MTQSKSSPHASPRISFLSRLADLLSPRFCCICGQRLTPTEQELCIGCNLALPRTGFADTPADNLLSRRFWGIVPVERCAALFFYEVHSSARRPVLRLKYYDHPEAAVFFGRMMANEFSGAGFFEGMDAVVPIPLSKSRLRQRGYNQSEMLARGIGEVTGLRVEADAVVRSTFKGSQTRLSRMERFDNVADIFSVVCPGRVAGRHILIIDDVITTGATTIALAQELLRAGVKAVSIASLACTKHL